MHTLQVLWARLSQWNLWLALNLTQSGHQANPSFKVPFQVLTSLEIAIYVIVKFILNLGPCTPENTPPSRCPAVGPFLWICSQLKGQFFRKCFLNPCLKMWDSIALCHITLFYCLVACLTFWNYPEVFVIVFCVIVHIPFLVWKLCEDEDFLCVIHPHWPPEPQSVSGTGWELCLRHFLNLMPSTVSGHWWFPLIYRFI